MYSYYRQSQANIHNFTTEKDCSLPRVIIVETALLRSSSDYYLGHIWHQQSTITFQDPNISKKILEIRTPSESSTIKPKQDEPEQRLGSQTHATKDDWLNILTCNEKKFIYQRGGLVSNRSHEKENMETNVASAQRSTAQERGHPVRQMDTKICLVNVLWRWKYHFIWVWCHLKL